MSFRWGQDEVVKKFRYEYLGGVFNSWSEADAFAKGYNAARKKAELESHEAKYMLLRDMGDGYFSGKKFPYDGFYVVRKIVLTAEEIQKKKEEIAQRRLKKAKEEASKALLHFQQCGGVVCDL